jgi:hypothetical protein
MHLQCTSGGSGSGATAAAPVQEQAAKGMAANADPEKAARDTQPLICSGACQKSRSVHPSC